MFKPGGKYRLRYFTLPPRSSWGFRAFGTKHGAGWYLVTNLCPAASQKSKDLKCRTAEQIFKKLLCWILRGKNCWPLWLFAWHRTIVTSQEEVRAFRPRHQGNSLNIYDFGNKNVRDLIATCYGLEGQESYPGGSHIFLTRPEGPGAHPSSYIIGTASLSWG